MDVCMPECREVTECHQHDRAVIGSFLQHSVVRLIPGYWEKGLSSLNYAKCEGTWESECLSDFSPLFIWPSAETPRPSLKHPSMWVYIIVFHAFLYR